MKKEKQSEVTDGHKHDGGKPQMDLLVDDMGEALIEVGKVLTFGAIKYKPRGWKEVPFAKERYRAAQFRHAVEGNKSDYDDETGLLHLAHEATNILFKLQLKLDEIKESQRG